MSGLYGAWLRLKISVPKWFPWYGQQNEGMLCHATREDLATIFLSTYYACEIQPLSNQTTVLCSSLIQKNSSAAVFTV
jgi:hypothetical protein